MTPTPGADVNVLDQHPENPWGSTRVWHHHGAVAIGTCRAHVEANPRQSDDVLWLKAKAVASEVFQVELFTEDPISDVGLLSAIDATMVPMLFAYMAALREQLRYKHFWTEAVRRRDDSAGPDGTGARPVAENSQGTA